VLCRGVAKFEHYCAEKDIEDVNFEVLSKLYEDPNNLDALPTDKLKLLARSMIQQTMDERCALPNDSLVVASSMRWCIILQAMWCGTALPYWLGMALCLCCRL
jgi:hypothetical protein